LITSWITTDLIRVVCKCLYTMAREGILQTLMVCEQTTIGACREMVRKIYSRLDVISHSMVRAQGK